MDSFLREIQSDFLIEAGELLSDVESFFMVLEKDPSNEENLHKIFRLMHNFKGSGKTVGFEHLAEFCHEVENLLVAIRNKVVRSDAVLIRLLLECCDRLKNDVELLKGNLEEHLDYSDIVPKIKVLIENGGQTETDAASPVAPVKTFSQPLVMNGKTGNERQSVEEYVRLPLKKIEDLINSLGEQVILQSTLELAKDDFGTHKELIVKTISQLSKLTHDLQQTTMSLRMVSLKNLFSRIERAIRDVSDSLGKEVEFVGIGQENELDKAIVDALIDPLTHMARNSVDHGIEDSLTRKERGKSSGGKICMKAYHQGGLFVLELSDDGHGLDPERIAAKGIKAGLISSAEGMSKKQILELIFRNGFSTKEEVTEVSGRGVGMNVVLEVIQKLRGTYEIESEVGKGTCFRFRVPLTLAVFNGMIIRVDQSQFVVSAGDVDEIIRASQCDFRDVSSDSILRYKDQIYNVVDLNEFVGRKNEPSTGKQTVLLSAFQGEKKAFLIDELVSLQKIVHKKMDTRSLSVPGASGVTILGDGSVALILDLKAVAQRDLSSQMKALSL